MNSRLSMYFPRVSRCTSMCFSTWRRSKADCSTCSPHHAQNRNHKKKKNGVITKNGIVIKNDVVIKHTSSPKITSSSKTNNVIIKNNAKEHDNPQRTNVNKYKIYIRYIFIYTIFIYAIFIYTIFIYTIVAHARAGQGRAGYLVVGDVLRVRSSVPVDLRHGHLHTIKQSKQHTVQYQVFDWSIASL